MSKASYYDFDVAILKDYGGFKRKISVHFALPKKGIEREFSPKGTVNDDKLDCNLSRAKRKVFEYSLCNDWDYFVTLTISGDKFDRTDLKSYYSKFSQFLRNYKRLYNVDIKYLFIPELHKDGKSWHMHGLISGLPLEHLHTNDNGYLDWDAYKKRFGYISLDKIKDKIRCSNYITKYITKNLSSCVTQLDAKLYYCSKGLKTAETIKRGGLLEAITPDYSNEYVAVQWFDGSVPLDELKSKFY